MSVGRATRNGTARRTCGEWGALLEDRDRWRVQALELGRALAATTAELFDARALAAQLDRRGQGSPPRAGGQRRGDDDLHTATCQCRGDEPDFLELAMRVFRP
jgi:hypothetical protein